MNNITPKLLFQPHIKRFKANNPLICLFIAPDQRSLKEKKKKDYLVLKLSQCIDLRLTSISSFSFGNFSFRFPAATKTAFTARIP